MEEMTVTRDDMMGQEANWQKGTMSLFKEQVEEVKETPLQDYKVDRRKEKTNTQRKWVLKK